MEQLTTTPFGRRPVTAGLIARAAARQSRPETSAPQDKWQLLRDLSTARRDYGLSDRTLMVLGALLSFHPEAELGAADNLIVFPSNRALSDRAHGMAESTLRRHLAKLVEAGILLRHDSPNGKRYVRRYRSGEIAHAFGFDLSPLISLAGDIARRAEHARALASELRLARERVSLLKRDALTLAQLAQDSALPCPFGGWDNLLDQLAQLQTHLRRKLTLHELTEIEAQLGDILVQISAILVPETEKLSGNDGETGRHYQSSEKEIFESEQTEPPNPQAATSDQPQQAASEEKQKGATAPPQPHSPQTTLPLPIVLSACPDIAPYHDGDIRDWHQLISTASRVRAMMGIDQATWEEALHLMGPEAAAVSIACLLQRFATLRNPGGYLRTLSAKARAGQFSTAPMVMALVNTTNRRAA